MDLNLWKQYIFENWRIDASSTWFGLRLLSFLCTPRTWVTARNKAFQWLLKAHANIFQDTSQLFQSLVILTAWWSLYSLGFLNVNNYNSIDSIVRCFKGFLFLKRWWDAVFVDNDFCSNSDRVISNKQFSYLSVDNANVGALYKY